MEIEPSRHRLDSASAYFCWWDKDSHTAYRPIAKAVWTEGQEGFESVLETHVLVDLHAERSGLSKEFDALMTQ